MIRQQIDKCLVCLQQSFDLNKFGCIVELSEVLRLLCQVLSLDGRVALVSDNIRGCVVQGWDEGVKVDFCKLVSKLNPTSKS